jgi:hypothetical protein
MGRVVNRFRTSPASAFCSGVLFVGLALLLVFAAGCGLTTRQQAGIAAFTGATSDLSASMAENFVRTRDDVVARRREMLELRSGSVRLNNPVADLDGPLDVRELDRRLTAAAVLNHYAQLLNALSEDKQASRMKAASAQFFSSLRQIEGVQLSEEKADAIGALILKLGGLFIDYKRKEAVREVVLGTRPALMKVADLVERDFDPQKLFWVGALIETHSSITNTLAKQIEELTAGDLVDEAITNGPTWTEAGISMHQEKYHALTIHSAVLLDSTRQTCNKMNETLLQFRKANDELCGLVQAPDFELGHLDEYVAQVQEMVRLGRILSNDGRK